MDVFTSSDNTTEITYLFGVHLDACSLPLSALPSVAPTEQNPFYSLRDREQEEGGGQRCGDQKRYQQRQKR